MKKIIATINKQTGEISIRNEGGECLSKELEKALGLDEQQPETYQQQQVKEEQKQST